MIQLNRRELAEWVYKQEKELTVTTHWEVFFNGVMIAKAI